MKKTMLMAIAPIILTLNFTGCSSGPSGTYKCNDGEIIIDGNTWDMTDNGRSLAENFEKAKAKKGGSYNMAVLYDEEYKVYSLNMKGINHKGNPFDADTMMFTYDENTDSLNIIEQNGRKRNKNCTKK